MPTLETIRRLKMEATTTGVTQATAELNKLSAAQEGVTKTAEPMAKTTDNASKGAASTAERYRRQTLMLDEAARMLDKYTKAKQVADQMLEIGKINDVQHTQRIADLSAKYEQASTASKAFAQATSGVNAALIGLSAGAGPVGVFLSGLGSWGVAAAVGIGAVITALEGMSNAAHAVAEKAIELKKFSDTTGLTVTQIQAFRVEGVKFGITSEEIETAIQRFTVATEELQHGSGNALDVLARYHPELIEVMQGMDNTADRLAVLRKAYDELGIGAQNAISKAFFGKGGISLTELIKQFNLATATQKFTESGRGFGAADAERLRNAEAENRELRKTFSEGVSKIFAVDVIEAENSFLRGLQSINDQFKEAIKNGTLLRALRAGFPITSAIADLITSQDPKKQQDDMQGLLDKQTELNAAMANYQSMADKAGKWPIDLVFQMERAVAELDKVNAKIEEMRNKQSTPTAAAGKPEIADPIGNPQAAMTMDAMIAKQKSLVAILGTLASVEDIVALKENELAVARAKVTGVTDKQIASLVALARVQAELAAVAPGTYERQLAALEALKAAYPGLTAAQAQAARSLNQQLQLAQAVTGVQKMMVQEAIDYQAALDRGLTAEQAATEAATKRAIAIAQVTSAAKAQLLSLQDQFAVASAVTGVEKTRAEALATINQFLRDGVEAETAMAVAAQQVKNAQAQANAEVDRQIHSLKQQTELIIASIDHTQELVKQQQAYSDAINNNVSSEKAQELVAAMRQQVAAQQELTSAQKLWDEANAREIANCKRVNALEQEHLAIINQEIAAENAVYQGASLLSQLSFSQPGGAGQQGMQGGVTGTGINRTVEAYLQEIEQLKLKGFTQAHIVGYGTQIWIDPGPIDPSFVAKQRQDALDQFEIQRVKAQISGDKGAELQAVQGELGFLQSQPQTLENLQAIKSLMDAIKELTDATQAQTATLSDIYGAGHAGRIGYYNEGSTTKVIGQPTISSNPPVWGNPITTAPAPANSNIPRAMGDQYAYIQSSRPMGDQYLGIQHFAEGGTVTRPTLALVGEAGPETITPVGKGGGPPTVVQNFNIMMPARSDLGDRSTQRQMFEGIGRRAAVAR